MAESSASGYFHAVTFRQLVEFVAFLIRIKDERFGELPVLCRHGPGEGKTGAVGNFHKGHIAQTASGKTFIDVPEGSADFFVGHPQLHNDIAILFVASGDIEIIAAGKKDATAVFDDKGGGYAYLLAKGCNFPTGFARRDDQRDARRFDSG